MASQPNPSKRPRLSLQIKTSCSPATRSSRSYAVDPRDATAFNTLSNVYVTAIERSTPVQAEPVTAINTLQSFSISTPVEARDPKQRVVTPYVASYPETPLSAHASSPRHMETMAFPSAMTATPPLSAGPVDSAARGDSGVFTFSSADVASARPKPPAQAGVLSPVEPRSARRRANPGLQPPYTHPRSLHSILRNSPLPPSSAVPPPSPRRQSLRLQEKAAKRVGYNNPLTQEIVTNKYTKSHIDLLVEEASPNSPAACGAADVLDLALAFAPNEIEDGGQTPGPFEDVRRRMAGLASSNPGSPAAAAAAPGGVRKRKRREKKRRWVWTIGQDDEDDNDDDSTTPMAPIPHITYLETPTPSIESGDSFDVDMSEPDSASVSASEDRGPTPDLKTPTAAADQHRDTPIPELTAPLRLTPVPPELLQ